MKISFAVVTSVFVGVCLIAFSAVAKEVALPRDWESYRHIGSLVVPDKNNALYGIHHFYLNNKGVDAFMKSKPYPDGTVIVDAVYEIKDEGRMLNEGKRAFFPVMKKNSGMKDTGGWEWYAFGADGKLLAKDPKKDCFSCHEGAKDSDYVFSRPLK